MHCKNHAIFLKNAIRFLIAISQSNVISADYAIANIRIFI